MVSRSNVEVLEDGTARRKNKYSSKTSRKENLNEL